MAKCSYTIACLCPNRRTMLYFYTCLLKEKTGNGIQIELGGVYGSSSALSYAQFKYFFWGFKRDRESLEDFTKSRRPPDATDENMWKENILLNYVHQLHVLTLLAVIIVLFFVIELS